MIVTGIFGKLDDHLNGFCLTVCNSFIGEIKVINTALSKTLRKSECSQTTLAVSAWSTIYKEEIAMSDSNPRNEDPITGEAGAHPVGTGVGATGGAVTGATVGTLIAGPVGTIVGAAIGAIAGGLAGKGVAEGMNPTEGGAPEEHPVGTTLGASGGTIAGASIGAIGASAGHMAGKGTGEVVNPKMRDEVGDHNLGTAVGAGSGAVAGALVGAVGGPIGMAVGTAVGGLTGAAAGHGVASAVNPAAEDTYWRGSYNTRPGYVTGYTYDEDYLPAYQLGYNSRGRYAGRSFEDAESSLKSDWDSSHSASRLTWDQARHAIRDAWNRI